MSTLAVSSNLVWEQHEGHQHGASAAQANAKMDRKWAAAKEPRQEAHDRENRTTNLA